MLSDYESSCSNDDFLFELPVEVGGSLDLNLLEKPKDSLIAFEIRNKTNFDWTRNQKTFCRAGNQTNFDRTRNQTYFNKIRN